MSWRDNLRRVKMPDGCQMIGASFRGVPFFVSLSERAGGRRTMTHEFPLRDDPYLEDLGRMARAFRVEGYVLGDNYVAQRNALISALEDTAGPGELVHPYHGRRRAICTGLAVRETAQDGRIAVFSIDFAEAPAQAVTPSEQPDLAALVDKGATAAAGAAEADLVATYTTVGAPAWAVASLTEYVQDAAAALGDALSAVTTTTQELARLNAELQVLTAEASSLVRDPADVLEAFVSVLDAVADTAASSPRAIMRAVLDGYDRTAIRLGGALTATRARERANQEALSRAFRGRLVIEAARLLVYVEHETHEEALLDRLAVNERLDEQAELASDTVYPSLIQLRARVSRAVPGDAVLSRVVSMTQRTAIPSLVLAHRLYGSVELEPDLVARNRASHPGFLSGDLRVLSRV